MKIDRTDLFKQIADRVARGIDNGEEYDVTAQKIHSFVWPIIEYLQDQRPEWIDEDFKKLTKAS